MSVFGRPLNRRSLLTGGAAVGALALTGGATALIGAPRPVAAQGALKVRKAFNELTDTEIEALRAAVRVMKERSPDDPRSWRFQANIHGTYDTPTTSLAKTVWNNCPHGGYYFLPWHRLFLYYFENLLRDAAQDPSLTLPYWNYTNQAYRSLPPALLQPATTSNPLWDPTRQPYTDEAAGISVNVGQGDPMPWNLIDPSGDWDFQNFCATVAQGQTPDSFGSIKNKGDHLARGFGALENQPHNNVHDLVGGNATEDGGQMSDINRAANDPAFWFHHSNIDRLWAYWISLRQQRANPVEDADWMNKVSTFIEVDGTPVQRKMSDALTTEGLGYTYDSVLPAGGTSAATTPRATPDTTPIVVCTDPNAAPLLLASVGTPQPRAAAQGHGAHGTKASGNGNGGGRKVLNLTRGRSTVTLTPPQAAPRALLQAEPDKRTLLVLQGVSVPTKSVLIPVYVNLPENTAASVESPYFAGTISVFGIAQGSQGKRMTLDRTFDITEVLKRQADQGLYKGGPVTVSIAGNVPSGVSVASVSIQRR